MPDSRFRARCQDLVSWGFGDDVFIVPSFVITAYDMSVNEYKPGVKKVMADVSHGIQICSM